MPKYLLIVGCSQRKNPSPYPMKAINRYEGVNFKVIKKIKRERTLPKSLDIVIISAKYGFLQADDMIDNYDVQMDFKRARELHHTTFHSLENLLSQKEYREIFINLGKDYVPALEGIEDLADCPVVYAEGRIGEKMAAMKQWILKASRHSEDQKTLEDLNRS